MTVMKRKIKMKEVNKAIMKVMKKLRISQKIKIYNKNLAKLMKNNKKNKKFMKLLMIMMMNVDKINNKIIMKKWIVILNFKKKKIKYNIMKLYTKMKTKSLLNLIITQKRYNSLNKAMMILKFKKKIKPKIKKNYNKKSIKKTKTYAHKMT